MSDIDKRAWVMAARMTFAPSDRQSCYVCGKFRSIAQAHHVIPLTAQYERGFKVPDHAHVWLCPNHHTMVHLFIGPEERSLTHAAMRARDATVATLNPDLSDEEFEKLLALKRAAFEVAP